MVISITSLIAIFVKIQLTQELLKEIEDHLHTTMRIIEHDFRKDYYFKVNLGYDSLRIIKYSNSVQLMRSAIPIQMCW